MQTRTLTFMTLLSATLLNSVAVAEYTGPVAHETQNLKAVLEDPKDEQMVRFQGYLTEKTGEDTYTFSDGTYKIQVEIDQHIFPKQQFDHQQKIEISGELEKDWNQDPEIEVETLTLVN